MSSQLSLTLTIAEQRAERERSLDARFSEFHAKNPHVYATLVRLARHARSRGCDRLGIKALWERMRWELHVETRRADGEEFQLNNSLTSRFARLIMAQEPDLAGMFETRELRS